MNTFQREKRDQSNITSDFKALVHAVQNDHISHQLFVARAREAGAFEAEVIEALVDLGA